MRMAGRIAASLAVLMLTARVASAEYVPTATPMPPPAAGPAFGWAGPYAGLFGMAGVRTLPGFSLSEPFYTGIQGGGLVGDLWQINEYLLAGVEVDAGFGPVGYDPDNPCTDPNQNCAGGELIGFLGPTGHLRAILGASGDRVMFFVAGGLAVTRATAGTWTAAAGGGEIDFDEDLITAWIPGWSIGAGTELRIGDSTRVRLETIYDMYFGGFDYSVFSSAVVTCCNASYGASGFFTPGSVLAVRLSLIHAF